MYCEKSLLFNMWKLILVRHLNALLEKYVCFALLSVIFIDHLFVIARAFNNKQYMNITLTPPASPLGRKWDLDVKPYQMDGMIGTLGLMAGFHMARDVYSWCLSFSSW